MFEARILTQDDLRASEIARRAEGGDEYAMAATYRDANGPLPWLFALLCGKLALATVSQKPKPASGRVPAIGAARTA